MLVVAVCEFAALEAADGTPISPMTAIGVMVVVTAVTSVTVAGPTFIYTNKRRFTATCIQPPYAE